MLGLTEASPSRLDGVLCACFWRFGVCVPSWAIFRAEKLEREVVSSDTVNADVHCATKQTRFSQHLGIFWSLFALCERLNVVPRNNFSFRSEEMRWSSPTQLLTLLRTVSNWVLGISEKGNSTTSQGNKTTKSFLLHLNPVPEFVPTASCPVVGSH